MTHRGARAQMLPTLFYFAVLSEFSTMLQIAYFCNQALVHRSVLNPQQCWPGLKDFFFF